VNSSALVLDVAADGHELVVHYAHYGTIQCPR